MEKTNVEIDVEVLEVSDDELETVAGGLIEPPCACVGACDV
ncbi:hypothetical protein [Plantactinospora endophytica]|uniref:Uncharacterized protein n=1 Tax=Plantactinospora endophytica TaxID=673535 RepID=A0ABQ4E7I9_9ACTN|nr:hypothetical protein [Plantactinospora endophytica]GIG90682.1 hypothetical protein Pen02_56180 [Plantactinospora endophytica]